MTKNKEMEQDGSDSIESRSCSYCKAKENEVRPVGGFKVELKEVLVKDNLKVVCQSCRIKVREVREAISTIG